VELLQGDALDDFFRRGEWRRAFHLETLDTYSTPEEDEPFRKFLDGEPDDLEWLAGWLKVVRDVTDAGKTVDRVRLCTVPHVDYTRFGLYVAPHNIAAGEDIRWLPRHLIDAQELTVDDWWMFDDDRVGFSIFEPGGKGAGAALTSDPTIAAYCRAIRDRVWTLAIPHHDYVHSEYATRT
jgi:hypothetical protein